MFSPAYIISIYFRYYLEAYLIIYVYFRSETLTNLYKQCYSKTLRPVTMTGSMLIQHIAQLLRELEKMLPCTES